MARLSSSSSATSSRRRRTHADDAAVYERLKRRLAAQFEHDGAAYTNAKVPFLWDVIRRADEWAQQCGWEPGPSDA